MANYEVISKTNISTTEILDSIEKKSKDVELTYREEKILEFLKKTNKLNLKDFNKAKKELMELEIPRLEEEHMIKVLEIMPTDGTQLRAIVSHSGTILVDENMTKILDVLKKYSK